MFSGNQWYTCTDTKTMYDICTITACQHQPFGGRLAEKEKRKKKKKKKKKKDDIQFCVGSDNAFSDIWRYASVFWQS